MKSIQKRIIVIFLITAATGALLDIVSKNRVFETMNARVFNGQISHKSDGVHHLGSDPVHPVIEGRFELRLRLNPGAVWGIFGEYPSLLLLLSGAAIAFILTILIRSEATSAPVPVALGLICAGAAGNLWDRIVFHGVRDFLHFYWDDPIGKAWPTFNLADVFICIGVGLYIFLELFATPPEETTTESKATAAISPTGDNDS